MAVKDWSTTAASNTGIISGMSLDGSVMTVNKVDDAFRDIAAQIRSQLGLMGFEGADIASATTTNLANATGWSLDVTGTTTITGLGTVDAGQVFILRFTGALILTHNATSLILPGAANITTVAGDIAIMKSEGSGNWRCVSYQRSSVVPRAGTVTSQVFTATGTWTKPAGCIKAVFEAVGGGGGSGGVDGQGAGTAGATGGGSSGFYGKTGVLTVTAETTAAVTIGAAGAAGSSSAGNGGNGGDTTITIGGTTYTWGGGGGSPGVTAGEDNVTFGGVAATGTNVVGGGWIGQYGFFDVTDIGVAHSGAGGSNPLGTGGYQLHAVSTAATAGNDGVGYGAGGGGAITYASASNVAGGAGTAGYMRVWEYY